MRMSDVISYMITTATAFSFFLGGSRCVAYDPAAQWDSRKNGLFIYLTPELAPGQVSPSAEFETIVNKWNDRIRHDTSLPEDLKRESNNRSAIELNLYELREFSESEKQKINAIISEEPEWLDPGQWENVDISGATISGFGDAAQYVFSELTLFKTAGVPITLDGLQRTKQWKERRLDCVRIEVGLSLVVSFDGWTIENSYLRGSFNFADASFFNSTIFDCGFKDVAVTRNAKENRLDSIKIILAPLISRDHTSMSQDWFFFGRCLYDPINLRALQPENLSAEEAVKSLLEAALEGKWSTFEVQQWGFDNRRQIRDELYPRWTSDNREVFRGAKPEDLYSTLAWKNGDMAKVVFFPGFARFKAGIGDLKGWNLAAQDLTGAKLERLDLTNVNLTDSVITDASFIDSIGLTVDQLKTTWNWRVRRMDDVKLPPELREEVDRALAAEASGKDE